MEPEVREAVVEDLPRLLEMAEQFWGLTEYDVPFDRESALKTLLMCADHKLCMVLDLDRDWETTI